MHNKTVNQVIIVGGGTAGWLTAAKLAKHLNSKESNSVQVTLIESPDIPTIGVGEGTWPTMRKTLAELGINENEFLTYCNASFKQGTKFVNWHTTPTSDTDQHYYHLFSSVVDPAEFNLSPYWSLGDKSLPYAEYVSAQAAICDLGLAPKLISNRCYEGIQNYAYHLDAGKFAELLRDFSCDKLGVKHIKANVTDVLLDKGGLINAVVTDKQGELKGELFVDCSGFKSLLLGKIYGINFISIKDTLLADHAVAIQVPYTEESPNINSTTMSSAQPAGWIWDIGLATRRGTGYVYASDFVSHDEAEQTLRDYIGPQAKNLDVRKIKMDCGYRSKFWHKNCVAIGLSAAFVEPLEASAIFLVEAAANMLCDQFPRHQSLMPMVEKKFNQSFQFRWIKTINFIKMHYCLSQRNEPFWQANRHPKTIPEELTEQLKHWKHHPVSRYDFSHVFDPFPQASYQYVLYGMGFEQKLDYARSTYHEESKASQYQIMNQKFQQKLLTQLPSNHELLQKVAKYGFQNL
ncbi:tryptophan halogenase family protein [Paraglaciecola sp.]|uniref:tryptophan halogenase family protein n=1 Tax=Paraglaciecola sp. TaxID=1920173 RepID=UPI0030F39DCB